MESPKMHCIILKWNDCHVNRSEEVILLFCQNQMYGFIAKLTSNTGNQKKFKKKD